MEMSIYMGRYKDARYNFFKWRHELEFLNKLFLALAFACLTGLLAQFRLYLPWTPVPITGQTFAVLLSAVILGRWGGVSQGMYVGFGAAGVPWFAGGAAGILVLAGPTGGFLIGFMVSAFFLGHVVDSYVGSRKLMSMLPLMLFVNFIIIHGLGLTQLYLWLYFAKGSSVGLYELLMMGTIPFVVGDLTKIAAAATIGKGITPKQAYGNEMDVL